MKCPVCAAERGATLLCPRCGFRDVIPEESQRAAYEESLKNARAAYEDNGYDMKIIPMRGGTDGAQLSYRGMPCPNMSAGYYNAHGVKEFCPVPELETMVDVLQTLVGLYAKPQDQQ